MLQALARALPKLRTQFGLIGLIVLVGGLIATRSLAPENTQAQIAAGAIGVTVIVFGQIFYFLRLIPEADRARFIVVMFLSFCVFTLALTAFAVRALAKGRLPVLSAIGLHSVAPAASGLAVDLDTLELTWSAAGDPQDMEVALENPRTGRVTPRVRVGTAEARLRFPGSPRDRTYEAVLQERAPGAVNRVRAVFYLAGDRPPVRSPEFDLYVGVRILFLGALPNVITAMPVVDDREVDSYPFIPEITLVRRGTFERLLTLRGEEARSHFDFTVPDPARFDWRRAIITYPYVKEPRVVRTEASFEEFLRVPAAASSRRLGRARSAG